MHQKANELNVLTNYVVNVKDVFFGQYIIRKKWVNEDRPAFANWMELAKVLKSKLD